MKEYRPLLFEYGFHSAVLVLVVVVVVVLWHASVAFVPIWIFFSLSLF